MVKDSYLRCNRITQGHSWASYIVQCPSIAPTSTLGRIFVSRLIGKKKMEEEEEVVEEEKCDTNLCYSCFKNFSHG